MSYNYTIVASVFVAMELFTTVLSSNSRGGIHIHSGSKAISKAHFYFFGAKNPYCNWEPGQSAHNLITTPCHLAHAHIEEGSMLKC
jgi:hypothetical protein